MPPDFTTSPTIIPLPDQAAAQQQQVIQGEGNWAGYIGPGMQNLSDPNRAAAMQQAGNGQLAFLQNPAISDAISDFQKMYAAYTRPQIPQGAENMTLSEIQARFGDRTAAATQDYFTANPTQRALDIVSQYFIQKTNIIGSSGTQRYLGETPDQRYAVYSEAGGTTPFMANVLTEYQQSQLGSVFSGGLPINAIGAIRGLESVSEPLIRGAYDTFIGGGGIANMFYAPQSPPQLQQVPQPSRASPDILANVGSGTLNPIQQPQAVPGQNFFSGVVDWFNNAVGMRASAAEGNQVPGTPQINRPTGGLDIGSPYIGTPPASVPITIPMTPAPMLGNTFQGPVRNEKEALDLNQLYRAAEFDVLGRPGFTPNAPRGSQGWAENMVELSSSYHNLAEKTGIQQPANPFEYRGDLALSYLKGTNEASKSSTYGENITNVDVLKLPGGLGIQDVAWNNALAGKGGAQPDIYPGYETAVNVLEAAKGQYGPYGALYGGGMYSAASSSGLIKPSEDYKLIQGYNNPNVPSNVSLNAQGGGLDIGAWLAGANEAVGGFLGLRANAIEQSGSTQASSISPQGMTLSTSSGQLAIQPSSGEIPYFGKIPIISDIFSYFSPQQKITTNTSLSPIANVTTITEEKPYTIGQTTYYPKNVTTTSGTNTTISSQYESFPSPFALGIQKIIPEPREAVSFTGLTTPSSKGGSYLLDVISSPFRDIASTPTGSAILIGAFGPTEYSAILSPNAGEKTYNNLEGPLSFVRGAVPMTPEWSKDTLENIREDPFRGVVSAGVAIALVGVGTGGKLLGLGEGALAPSTAAGGIYQTASKVASAALVGLYASEESKKIIGVTPGEIEQKFLPSMGTSGFSSAEGPSSALRALQTSFPGWEESRRQLNAAETLDILPMVGAFSATSSVSDRIVGYARTAKLPEITNPSASGYMAEEGFPTNQNIKTQDLVNSFKSGVITLENPAKLSETIMAPSGAPIERIPVGSQIGAPEGKTFIYTGAEYPFLNTGYIGESASELPAMFTSPQRISYFTKAGNSQAGGFGITSDIFGLYRLPTAYRSVVTSGEYQEIPSRLTNAPNPVNPSTGKPWSINDPLNPKNIPIAEWLRTNAEPGVPAIGQYGKSEWQFLIPSGSETISKPTGYYIDEGVRIPQYDVTFSGERSKLYTAPKEKLDPITGDRLYKIGKVYAGVSESAISTERQTIIPISIPQKNIMREYETSIREGNLQRSDISNRGISDIYGRTYGLSDLYATSGKLSESGISGKSSLFDEVSSLSKSGSRSESSRISDASSVLSSGVSSLLGSSASLSRVSSALSDVNSFSRGSSYDRYFSSLSKMGTTETSSYNVIDYVTSTRRITTTEIIPTGGLGYGGGGSGGFGPFSYGWKTNRKNPVVDIEYLQGLVGSTMRGGKRSGGIIASFSRKR